MADLSKIKLDGTTYNLKDTVARDRLATIPTKINDLTEYNNFGIGYIDCTNANRYIFVSNVKFGSTGASDYSSYFLLMFIKGTQSSSNPVTIAGTGYFRFYDINNNSRNDYTVQISSEEIATLKCGTLYIARLNDGILKLFPLTTKSEVNSLIASAIGNINSFEVSVVASLPTSDIDTHTIYFVSNSSSGDSIYDEYMYINNNWEKIGSTAVDLSNYLQKTDISDWAKAATKPTYTASEVGAAASNHTHTEIGITGMDNKGKVATTSESVKIDAYVGQGGSSNITLSPGKIKLLASTYRASTNSVASIIFSTYPYSGSSEIQHIKLSNGTTTINGIVTPTTNDMAANKKYVDDSITAITHPTNISAFNNDVGYLTSFTEIDPTVPAWAKASTKPTYTASEVGAVPKDVSSSAGANYGQIYNTATSVKILNGTMSGSSLLELKGPQLTLQTIKDLSNTSIVLKTNSTNNITLSEGNTTIIGVVTPTSDTMAANKKYVDDAVAGVTDTNTTYTLSMSGNIITLTPSTGTPQTITLPVYNGGVSS